MTLPLLYALTKSDAPERDEMRELIRKEGSLSETDIRRLITFANENGGVEYAYKVMEDMRAEAVRILSQFNSPVTAEFIALLDFVILRET